MKAACAAAAKLVQGSAAGKGEVLRLLAWRHCVEKGRVCGPYSKAEAALVVKGEDEVEQMKKMANDGQRFVTLCNITKCHKALRPACFPREVACDARGPPAALLDQRVKRAFSLQPILCFSFAINDRPQPHNQGWPGVSAPDHGSINPARRLLADPAGGLRLQCNHAAAAVHWRGDTLMPPENTSNLSVFSLEIEL